MTSDEQRSAMNRPIGGMIQPMGARIAKRIVKAAGARNDPAAKKARTVGERCPNGTYSGSASVPYDRWRNFVAAAARFLAGPFAERASALGWTALDLFGCDDSRPLARLDRAGLIWLLNGRKLVALTAEMAVVQTRTGTRQTYRRPREPRRVLAWELS